MTCNTNQYNGMPLCDMICGAMLGQVKLYSNRLLYVKCWCRNVMVCDVLLCYALTRNGMLERSGTCDSLNTCVMSMNSLVGGTMLVCHCVMVALTVFGGAWPCARMPSCESISYVMVPLVRRWSEGYAMLCVTMPSHAAISRALV